MNSALFLEKQRFNQPWIWFLLVGLTLLFLWAIYKQIVLGQPFGEHPAPDALLLFFLIIPIGLLIFFRIMYLRTEISTHSVKIQFYPFTQKEIRWTDIDQASIHKYRPIREYGGWGIRAGFARRKAYTISGNQGIHLVLKSGQTILIGTQRPGEAAVVLEQLGY